MPEPFEYVGVRPVIVKPASAIGAPLFDVMSRVYSVREVEDVEEDMLGARRSIWLEYDAEDCHVEVVAADVGHIPPNTYIVLCEALVLTMVEKLNAFERKSAPGRAEDVTSLDVHVISCSQVPPALVFEGVNLHMVELRFVEQKPV